MIPGLCDNGRFREVQAGMMEVKTKRKESCTDQKTHSLSHTS